MESKSCKQFQIWLLFLAILLASGILLAFVGGKGVTKPGKPLAMNTSPQSHTLSDLQADTAAAHQLSFIKKLSASQEWSNGVKAYISHYIQPKSEYFPPAGRPVAKEIDQLQHQPKPDISQFKSLIITGAEKVPSSGGYYLNVDGIIKPFASPLKEQFFGPFRLNQGNLVFQLTSQGWLSSSRLTEPYSLPASHLIKIQPLSIKLKVYDEFRNSLGPSIKDPYIHLNLTVVPFNPELESGENGDPRTPQRHAAATDLEKFASSQIEGIVSFDAMNASDELVILSPKRHLTVLVIGDADLKKYVQCTHANLGAIGAYNEHLPLFAVTANDWDSLRLHIGTFDMGQKFHYQIVALSGDEPTTKQLFLWFVGHRLDQLKSHGAPLSRDSAHDTVRWLMRVLDVTFSAQEVENIRDANVKTLLTHFQTLPK
jgi:uncharacterized protein (UPF0333 family)